MGRQHPEYCEHDFCIDPGDESFGLTEQECPFCAMTEYPEMAARIAELEKENAALRNEAAKGVHTCHANCPRPMCVLTRENEALKSAMRDIYEVWAGSEGLTIETDKESDYLLRLVEQMRDIAAAAIASPNA